MILARINRTGFIINAARETGDRLEPVVGGSPIDSRANETRGAVFASINRSTYQIDVHLRNPVRNGISLSDEPCDCSHHHRAERERTDDPVQFVARFGKHFGIVFSMEHVYL